MGSVTSTSNIPKSLLSRKNFNDFYEIGTKIGVGSFATVHKCNSKTTNPELGKEFAVKIINKWYLSEKELVGLQNEIQILKKISHKNIIKLIDVFDDGKYVSMVLELCNGKDLFDEIVTDKKKCFSEQKSAEIIYALANGLEHLHKNGVVHRDLKPENILFGIDNTLKITDFGLAGLYTKISNESENKSLEITSSANTINTSYESTLLHTTCGTPHYVAPEVLQQKGYDSKCDLWSLGVILYILLVGYQPFNADSVCDIYKLIANGKYNFKNVRWNNISDGAKDLIKRLLEVDPTKRYSAKDIKYNAWIIKHIYNNGNKLKQE